MDRCTSDVAWWCGEVWGGVLDVGNVSRETLVRICVDDIVRGSVMLLSWRYGRCYREGY